MGNSMTSPIQLDSISKCYRIFQNPQDRFKQALMDRFQNVLGKKNASPLYREHWALRDVSFELQPGEAVGILGRNGAGKSTLLQIIAGTLEPTAGSVKTTGRITALLELGSGFNPEFTGRENVFLNAQILGMSRDDALAHFDDIASFADIGDFIDQPVKIYSSGMMMRLAFAVQTELTPNLLIIDEAIAVGDMKFQEKCYRKLKQLRDGGTSVLFVSHDTNAITNLCDRALLIEGAALISSGKPFSVVKKYMEVLYSDNPGTAGKSSQVKIEQPAVSTSVAPSEPGFQPEANRFGNKKVEILSVQIDDATAVSVATIISGDAYKVSQRIFVHTDVFNISCGLMIRNRLGIDLFGVTNKSLNIKIPMLEKNNIYEITFGLDMHLAAGDYFLQIANAGEDGIQYDCWIEAMHFKVVNTPGLFTTSIVNLNPRLEAVQKCIKV